MPVAMAVAGALCAALLGFGCFKAVRLVSQIKAYKEGTKAVNVATPPDFLALQGGFLGRGAAIGRPLTFFRINDEVMGGKSTSSLAVRGGGLEFAGEINTNGMPLDLPARDRQAREGEASLEPEPGPDRVPAPEQVAASARVARSATTRRSGSLPPRPLCSSTRRATASGTS